MSAMPVVVAVINSSADTVEMLRLSLQGDGFESVTAHIDEIKRGVLDFPRFLEEHDPRVLIYDVSPPYEQNWTFLNMLCRLDVMQGRALVVTTTHKANLEKLVGPTEAIEILGKPYDLEEVMRAVKRAVGEPERAER
jgi:DNA-binding NtrC family response regulator